jgi:DNA helicase II / ATP-dependent DNA helicase PcrA
MSRPPCLRPLPAAGHKDIEAWIRSLLQKEVLSVTHLNNYLECPRKFYVRNILRVPAARSYYQALGSAVHGALDDFHRRYKEEKVLPDKQRLIESFAFHISRELLTAKEREMIEKEGTLILLDYYEQYKDDFLCETLGEYDFRSHGVNIDGISLTGKVDKIELLDTGAVDGSGVWKKGAPVNVVDYKTGNPDRGLRKLKKGESYYRQLVFYKLLCAISGQFPYEMVSGEVDFVQPSEKKGFIKQRVTVTGDDVEELQEEVRRVWSEIQALQFLQDDAACGKCEYCVGK